MVIDTILDIGREGVSNTFLLSHFETLSHFLEWARS